MKIIKAVSTDPIELTALTIESKSHWDYSSKQIESWKDSLTISPEYICQGNVYKLIDNNDLIGYYSYIVLTPKKVKLDNIFIKPIFIGKGYGKIMMNHLFELLKSNDYERIVLEADSNVETFYRHFGFKVIGRLESSIKNRFLPIMELEL
ncbi:MAG: GNAT family N-acetyltransferase [Crocinitomicaceae bacterium]